MRIDLIPAAFNLQTKKNHACTMSEILLIMLNVCFEGELRDNLQLVTVIQRNKGTNTSQLISTERGTHALVKSTGHFIPNIVQFAHNISHARKLFN